MNQVICGHRFNLAMICWCGKCLGWSSTGWGEQRMLKRKSALLKWHGYSWLPLPKSGAGRKSLVRIMASHTSLALFFVAFACLSHSTPFFWIPLGTYTAWDVTLIINLVIWWLFVSLLFPSSDDPRGCLVFVYTELESAVLKCIHISIWNCLRRGTCGYRDFGMILH